MCSDHDRVTRMDLGHRYGSGCSCLPVHQNAAIHLRPLHGEPTAVHAHEGLEIGGGVEVLRKDTVRRSLTQSGILLLDDLDPVLLQALQYGHELFLVGSTHPQDR